MDERVDDIVVTSDGTRRAKPTHYPRTLRVRVSDELVEAIEQHARFTGANNVSTAARDLLEIGLGKTATPRGSSSLDEATLDAYRTSLDEVRVELNAMWTAVNRVGINWWNALKLLRATGRVEVRAFEEVQAEIVATRQGVERAQATLARLEP